MLGVLLCALAMAPTSSPHTRRLRGGGKSALLACLLPGRCLGQAYGSPTSPRPLKAEERTHSVVTPRAVKHRHSETKKVKPRLPGES